MTTGEALILSGVIISFLTTIAGWVFTYRSQRSMQNDLVKLQEKFAFDREKRQYTLPDKLKELKEIAEWFDLGLQLTVDAIRVLPQDVEEYNSKMKTLRLGLDAWQKLIPQYVVRAEQYDPKHPAPRKWPRDSRVLPEDLPQLIAAFGFTATLFVQAEVQTEVYLEPPNMEEVSSLHKAGLAAVERVRQHLVAQ